MSVRVDKGEAGEKKPGNRLFKDIQISSMTSRLRDLANIISTLRERRLRLPFNV